MNTVTVSFRIPSSVHIALKREAERDRRSLNFVVVETLRSTQPVHGYVWCDVHGCVHNDSTDPYDEGSASCTPEDHAALFSRTDGDVRADLHATIRRLQKNRTIEHKPTKRAKEKR